MSGGKSETGEKHDDKEEGVAQWEEDRSLTYQRSDIATRFLGVREEEVPRVFTSRGDDQRGLREAEGGDESIRYRDSFRHDEARRTACDGDDCTRFEVHFVKQRIALKRLALDAQRH